jgi:hypothetical protein
MTTRKANDYIAAKDTNTTCTTSISTKKRNNHLVAQSANLSTAINH